MRHLLCKVLRWVATCKFSPPPGIMTPMARGTTILDPELPHSPLAKYSTSVPLLQTHSSSGDVCHPLSRCGICNLQSLISTATIPNINLETPFNIVKSAPWTALRWLLYQDCLWSSQRRQPHDGSPRRSTSYNPSICICSPTPRHL